MRLFRKRPRLRPLDERECYLRLHGVRSGQVGIVDSRSSGPTDSAPLPGGRPASLEPAEDLPPVVTARPVRSPSGPTDPGPALHLVIDYPRNASRLTGEQVRNELLRRMQARAGAAA